MKTKTSFVFPVAVVVLSCVGLTNAAVLGTIEYNYSGRVPGPIVGGELSELIFSIGYPRPAQFGSDFSRSLSWNFTPDDVGKTFFASADTHGSFNDFVSLLTNGVDDHLALRAPLDSRIRFVVYAPVFATYESEVIDIFIGSPVDSEGDTIDSIAGISPPPIIKLGPVDFEGYTIDSIGVTVNELFMDYHEDSFVGIYTDTSCDITYTIYGAPIPEPATVLLFGIGAVLLRGRRRV